MRRGVALKGSIENQLESDDAFENYIHNLGSSKRHYLRQSQCWDTTLQ